MWWLAPHWGLDGTRPERLFVEQAGVGGWNPGVFVCRPMAWFYEANIGARGNLGQVMSRIKAALGLGR